ncbi:transcription factor Sp3 isoform X1 [Bactrocera dorsalis]|uniref:Transcription factor Sp3 isoform X1 n=1 Tax=Bactrocera dorsalis TaxID=27457 RepID=A0A6J0RP65_BACDO|nr:transcription factor Sp3 isoform X1 [Bactrocera dorsalis]XP_029408419.1 transcription factor Sp3 isoform X1 [Bactrocera dorsalis]XP_049303503.1 transcription factor Sp3 isoform X1 [Bactrocera dorsalis]
MMNFSAFGGPFSGIHQFAAKFGHDTQGPPGAFATPTGINGNATAGVADNHVQRYQTNGNHFNQNIPNVSAANNTMQYGQNISIPYSQPQTDLNFLNSTDHKGKIHPKIERDREEVLNQQILQNVNQSWQTLANTANTVDYSSHLLSATLPISIQHFLKYSETIKKESSGIVGSQINSGNLNLSNLDTSPSGFKGDVLKNGTNLSLALGGVALAPPSNQQANGATHHNGGIVGMDHTVHMTNMTDNTNNGASLHQGVNGNAPNPNVNGQANNGQPTTNGTVTNGNTVTSTAPAGATTTSTGGTTTTTGKKTRKKKPPKEKKPRPKPGEIREIKALDGSTLYCCPECQMAYPDRSLIEQHVISHAVERRFVCDICNAALKRKDHLTRHKLSHIPDRPHVCNICMKSFKRKEQLTLHIVIHSGEKKHVCVECGKGFYRKDHLRKHTRSHIARRVKSEVSAQNVNGGSGTGNTAQNNTIQGS